VIRDEKGRKKFYRKTVLAVRNLNGSPNCEVSGDMGKSREATKKEFRVRRRGGTSVHHIRLGGCRSQKGANPQSETKEGEAQGQL